MAFISLKAWKARSAEQAAQSARLKSEIAAALALGPEDALTVNAIACPDPGCPDIETVVLVMRAREPTRAFRIRRPLEAVEAADIETVAQEERGRRAAGTA
ncbi:hypothetical protein J2X36_003636 [Methylobacterium sp. BE186]|uniref:hypothetical protein n=1 Tax=Methylobacterium sp. BE186 TaxID=2817715 RepID=UPI002862C07C|nr:hypothetical protein [Methylobacterium sp. BE186]MDR7038864.1 hypothetical protein [Methylobacterium sp. BE186]